VSYLRECGVRFECNAEIQRINCRHGRITDVIVKAGKIDPADYYIAALPVNVIRNLVTKEMGDRDPGLWRLHELHTSWMNGIQFYLKEDVPIIAGHVIYTDSPWALTSISQQQFWSKSIRHTYGDGRVGGILSVDVSNWDVPGNLCKKPASECSRDEIKKEVWQQLKDHLNRSGINLLKDSNRVLTGMDRDICCSNAGHTTDCINREPMLINTVGSLNSRPEAATKIENLFLASDYVRTFTDIATMEAANEAARRAVNGILKASGSADAPCQIWPMEEPLILNALREIDALCYAAGGPHPLTVRLESSLSDFVMSAILQPGDELRRLKDFTQPLRNTLASAKSVSFSDVANLLESAAQGLKGLSLGGVGSTAFGSANILVRHSLRKVTHQPRYIPDPEAHVDKRPSKVTGVAEASVPDTAETKVAILGGGISSIAAAFKLTSTPELRKKYKVTVYQRGWRIGGKGASGRNRQICNRIEEHGLHVWFGFYHNAFKLMRDCYAELERPEGAPLRTLEDAFKPCDNLVLFDETGNEWKGWQFSLPRNNFSPGDDDVNLPAFWDVTHVALGWLWSFWEMLIGRGSDPLGTPASGPEDTWSKAKRLLRFAEETTLFKKVMSRAGSQRRRPAAYVKGERPGVTLAQLLTELRDSIWTKYTRADFEDDAWRRFFECLDFATTVVCGIVSDELLIKGFDSVNDRNLKDWLIEHGIQGTTLKGPLGRLSYDAAFAFMRGNPKMGNYAAGTALMGLLRGLFCYAGAVSFKMQAGMGDAVFAPLYQVLKKRRVRFKFFHSVDRLRLSSNKNSIESIDVIRQVDLKSSSASGSNYRPLFKVKGIRCWPTEPLWEQIKSDDVARLRKEAPSKPQNFREIRDNCLHNLEHEHNPLKKAVHTLSRGDHFDIVILGIPVDALKDICGELLDNEEKPKFRRMLENSATIMTQAFQLWTHRTLDGLGWPFEQNSVACTYSDPYDTYCNMNQLLCRESWDSNHGPVGLDYFCSALSDTRPEDGRKIKCQKEADEQAQRNAVAYLRERIAPLWPDSREPGNTRGFNWNLLYSPRGDYQDDHPFLSQYWIANFQPSERYTLSPAGKVKYRLKTNESGYDNLYLTGDWTNNGMNAGCIESAVISGLEAARAITQSHEQIIGEDDHLFGIPNSKEGFTRSDESGNANMENERPKYA
jgi:uncharacterized protein with NAD-binding domain and iron-sulfur cluster